MKVPLVEYADKVRVALVRTTGHRPQAKATVLLVGHLEPETSRSLAAEPVFGRKCIA